MEKEFNFNGIKITVDFDREIAEEPSKVSVKETEKVEDKGELTVLRGIGMPDNYEGMFVAVQKPKPDYYEPTDRGQSLYQEHLAKYQALEKAAKACDWPNDLIDNGLLEWPMSIKSVPTDVDYDELIDEVEDANVDEVFFGVDEDNETYLHRENGRAPIGAVVIDYTEKGEPIYG